MKKLLSIILSLAMLLSCVTAFAENDEIKVMLDGERVEFDVAPIIENDRVLVPMRAVFEALGTHIVWDEKSQTARAFRDKYDDVLSIAIGSKTMVLQAVNLHSTANDGTSAIHLDVPAQIINDRTLVPLRAVSEGFGCDVEWDEKTRTVTITSSVEATPIPTEQTFEEKLLSKMPQDKNYMVSPFSIKTALAMAANGAGGETQAEMLKALDITDIDEFNEYIKSFFEYISNAEKENNADENSEDLFKNTHKKPVFELANSIWINDGYKGGQFKGVKFTDEFSKIIEECYSGTSDRVTEENKVEKINGWVKEKTHDKIDGIIDENTQFIAAIMNAIYMKAQWQNQFSESATYKEEFADRNGKKSEIDFMHETEYYDYYGDNDIQLIRLPYYGGLSMYVAMGDAQNFRHVKDKCKNTRVKLSLPRFKIESRFDLNDILKDLGIQLAFNPTEAVFDKMLMPTPYGLCIDAVLHKTFIDVDEQGTEAAAVTFIAMKDAAVMQEPDPIEFKADKPFTYFICDDETGQIFFMGEYAFAE